MTLKEFNEKLDVNEITEEPIPEEVCEEPVVEAEAEESQEAVLTQAEDGSWRHAENSPFSPFYVPDKKQTKSISYFSFISWFALILGIITGVVLLEATLPMLICNVSSSVMVAVALAIGMVVCSLLLLCLPLLFPPPPEDNNR